MLFETSVKLANQHAGLIEQKIRLVLNEKPSWLPESVWFRLIKLLIRIEYQPIVITSATPASDAPSQPKGRSGASVPVHQDEQRRAAARGGAQDDRQQGRAAEGLRDPICCG
jgi:hypothetical protein